MAKAQPFLACLMPYDTNSETAKFLQEARDRFRYCLENWQSIREQHDLDMRFLAGDQWEDVEKRRRKDKRIPCVTLDELNQFTNQLVNDVRQNKRAVKVEPMGNGATSQSADTLGDWIRAVEYDSQAQSAYITAFESGVSGSYGFWKLETYYASEKSFDLSVRICPVQNANTIVYDPDCKKYDCSDAQDCFEIDFISHEEFKRRWPKAEISEFSEEIRQIAPDWIKKKQVQIASWWKVEVDEVKLHLVDIGDGQTKVMRSDQLPENLDKNKILKSRDYEDRRIIQYILNGVEILETNDPRNGKGWPGNWIPIIPYWGKEMFVDEGSGSERILLSEIRMARDPQRLLNYYASQEMMEAKKTPATPYMGPKGMFSNQAEQWESINEEGRAWVEFEIPEGFQPGSVKPERVPFVPNFQQYELAKEAARRHIMAAMGIAPLPTTAQRNNEKSGVALTKIQGERSEGSFHFIDNYDRSLEFSGRQLQQVFPIIHDTARDVPLRKEDGTHRMARVNDPGHPQDRPYKGDHNVAISTGPSYHEQQEEVEDFSDVLIQIPGVFEKIGDLVVRLRRLGPLGNQIAERLTPPQFANLDDANMPDNAKAALGQLHQQLQQTQAALVQLNQEKAAKMWEMDGKLQIEKIHSDTQKAVAEINTKAQALGERLKALEDLQADFHQMAHETALSAQEHQQTLQQGQQAADLAPKPEPGQNGSGQ